MALMELAEKLTHRGVTVKLNPLREVVRGRRLVVLLDGGSGAGKTTLARRLHRDLEARLGTTQLVSLDDVYPGWHGLAAASELVWQSILRPASPGYPGWDWARDQPSGWRG